MKKITLLIALMIYSLGFSQTPDGTWKFTSGAGAFQVGPSQGSNAWYQNSLGDVNTRACQFDDEFVLNLDGSFQNVLQGSTWLEATWQTATEGCGTPVAPHDGVNPATWVYSAGNNTITLSGIGAFLGLPKAVNTGELSNPATVMPASRTYIVSTLTASNMTLDIECGTGVWWRFNFTKKQVGQPVIGALTVPTATVGDAPFDIVDPVSDSPGTFSYTSSNTAVATITGNTVFVVGPGTTTITATQAASAPYVSGIVSADLLVHDTPPGVAAPTPPVRNPADVISIYSGAYTDLVGTAICQCWGQSTIVDEVDPGNGDVFKRMEKFTYQGVVMAGSSDVSGGMWKLHIDMLNKDLVPMKISLISPGAENPVTVTPTVVGWNSFDIDVNTTNYPTPVLSNIGQIKLESATGSTTTYFDNLYFWKTTLGVAKFDASGIKMYPNPVKNTLTIDANSAIQRVSVYNVLGQEVMNASPKSNTVTLQTNELQKGVYMVTTEIDGKTSTSKVVKE
ncbi:T9SS type A sorting domain-containing protein [Flavobacterium sp.]|uniref:T9SS type A sorting domain-containing protein n=1 Tax=Flavobacterium sp. TaxID=239 RepID=UPI0037505FC0